MSASAPADSASLLDRLRSLEDPEIGLNIVDLGMVYSISCDGAGIVSLDLIPTTPHCPMKDQLVAGARSLLGALPGVNQVMVSIVLSPPWTPDRITPAGRKYLGGTA